jgi:ribose-phosphate pyrophosphokinase
VLQKIRRGDRDVEISIKDVPEFNGRTPVLLDDIISSARTMIEAVRLLTARGTKVPVCVAVHGIFADGSETLLAEVGAHVVTTNSIPHLTNRIDLAELLTEAVGKAL